MFRREYLIGSSVLCLARSYTRYDPEALHLADYVLFSSCLRVYLSVRFHGKVVFYASLSKKNRTPTFYYISKT